MVFAGRTIRVRVAEEARAQVVLVPAARAGSAAAVLSRRPAGAQVGTSHLVRANVTRTLGLPRAAVAARYVVAVVLSATMNPARRQVALGPTVSFG